MKILYVDDHLDTTIVMGKALSKIGHDASRATSFQMAKTLCERNQYDLLIVDLSLPDGDGLELLKSICGDGQTKGMVISGHGLPIDIQRTHDAGFQVHLIKPVTIEQIKTTIETLT